MTFSNGWPMGAIMVPQVASKDLLAPITSLTEPTNHHKQQEGTELLRPPK